MLGLPGIQIIYLNITKQLNLIPHINQLKKRAHTIISIYVGKKHFRKSTSIHSKKCWANLGTEGNFLNLIKDICNKLRGNITLFFCGLGPAGESATSPHRSERNITLNSKMMKSFPLRSITRQGCLILLLLFDTVQDALNCVVKKEN